MSNSPVVLVTGATGAIGPAVVAAFLQAGYCVRVFSRTPPAPRLYPSAIEHVCGEITDLGLVQQAMQGADSVIHLAALLHIADPAPALRPLYWRTNVDGTQIVVEAAQVAGVRRLVFSSSIAVYGSQPGHLITESHSPHPDTLYGESKLAAERLVLQARRQNGEQLGVVVRLASVYGARVKGNYLRLVQTLARGTFVTIGAGDNRRTLIYERDVANALLLCTTHARAAGETFNLSDGACPTMREIMAQICHALKRNPPTLALPVGPARLAAGWLEDGAQLVGLRSPIRRATIDKYVEDVQVSGQRLQELLDFRPHYNLASGWQETIQTMRAAGEL